MKTIKFLAHWIIAAALLVLFLRTIPGVRFVTDFFVPILFYGKVVDENGNPVPSAMVRVSFANNPGGSSGDRDLETDAQGRFSAWGHGLGIVAAARKGGYYILPQSGVTFAYCSDAGKTDRHMLPAYAGILVLRKMGVCEPLMERSMGGRFAKFGANGSPISLDLSEGRAYRISSGDIRIQAWIEDQNVVRNPPQHYDWRVVITVPGGGLQPRSGEFDFEAPVTGYQPSDEIDMSASAERWSDSATREYFLKLANGRYARVKIDIAAGGDKFFSIVSYLNPAPGHTNLEYDATKQINK